MPTPCDDRDLGAPAPEIRSILDEVEPVAESDPRLRHDAAVDLERQRRLLALRDRLRHVGHFELLGIDPVDDPKMIRRAYHAVSREFHPDSFYGKNVGTFRSVLDDLFRRARASYEFLLDDEQRKPLVEAHDAQLRAARDRREREQAEAKARAEAAAERARVRAEAEAAEAAQKAQDVRAKRDQQRQNRIRDRALAQRRKQAKKHADQAAREQEVGRHGAAATLFRLAFEQDPSKPEYEQMWRESLGIARRQRADSSYEQGREARKAGRVHEAARCLALAADADPSLRNLAEAAGAMAEVNAQRGRELAMAALESLQQAKARGSQLDERTVATVHQACARAFLAAGQHASAREQAERAHELSPSNQTRTLLNSIKLT
ncbi:DnaJ domain protein [Enhygromyxa salina]|uniref:DnaJ domain protein n=1 Tax=Enhygromyxa salina TaxID=215803 RepID=A0A2S9YFZ1_9BACT|nr:DnaJ domain protein [Enhygromyxa salina]